MEKLLFTSESVTEGHPDKMCDAISDAILDALLEQDPMSRVACETATTTGLVLVMGEITTKAYVDIQKIVRDTIREIGYTRGKYGFDADTCGVITAIDEQSGDIAMGVDKALEAKESQEAVDNVAKDLQTAIDGLKKVDNSNKGDDNKDNNNKNNNTTNTNTTNKGTTTGTSTTNKGTTGTTATTNKGTTSTGTTGSKSTGTTSTSSNAKTGDPTSIWGWISLAVTSMGVGGFSWKARKKSRKDEEEK